VEELQIMKKIFTTKISLQSSNPTFSYPIIRFPRELKELAGRVATIYQTEIEGVQGFFIALQLDNLDNLDKFVEDRTRGNLTAYKALIDQSTPKERWARPDSNRRPPPCEGDVTAGSTNDAPDVISSTIAIASP